MKMTVKKPWRYDGPLFIEAGRCNTRVAEGRRPPPLYVMKRQTK